MIQPQEKPLHWVEAFGLSALVHVGFAYFVLTAVVDVGAILDLTEQDQPEVQITSLSIDTQSVFSPDIGTGQSSGTGVETLEPLGAANVLESASDVQTQTAATRVAPAQEVAPLDVVEPANVGTSSETLANEDALTPVATATVTVDATEVRTAETQNEVTTASAIGPDALSPLRPVNPTLAPVAAAPVQTATQRAETEAPPNTAPASQANRGSAIATAAQAPVVRRNASLTPVTDLAAAQEQLGAPAPAPLPASTNPAAPDPLAADLIARIRASVGATCMIAIPQQQNGTVGLQIFAADDAAVGAYSDEILAGLSPRPPQSTILVDPRQCAALDYIRGTAGYPTGPMALGLDAARIDSGTELTGRLSGTGGRNITLVLVDDNGVTQDLGNYLTVGVNTARFAAPLRRAGVARDTRQLLLAIGTATRPTSSSRQNGQLAEDYFGALTTEIAGRATITVAPFDVR